MRRSWNRTTDEKTVREAIRATGTVAEAAVCLGVSPYSLHNLLAAWRLPYAIIKGTAPLTLANGTGLEASVAKAKADAVALKARNRQLEKELKAASKQLTPLLDAQRTAADIRSTIKAAASAPATVARIVVRNRKPSRGPGVPTAIISDLHLNERIVANQVFGVNEFNLTIAKQRLDTYFRTVVDLGRNHMVKPSREGIVVPVLGDLLDFLGGRAHRLGRRPEIEGVDAAALVADLLEPGFRLWADAFGGLWSHWVNGNHDRITEESVYEDPASVSLSTAIFHILEGRLRDRKDIHMQHARGPRMIYSVYDHRYMILHGDPSGGMPRCGDSESGWINTVARGVKRLRSLHMQLKQPFDTLLCGHGHQEVWIPGAISNGCFPGFGEYANGKALSFDTPKQAYFYTHAKYGITCRWTVHLDKDSTAKEVV
jgi:hypothetical protein